MTLAGGGPIPGEQVGVAKGNHALVYTLNARLARLRRRVVSREGALVVALLLLATIVRLPLMPFHGYYHDLATYVSWGSALVNHGFSNLYSVVVTAPIIPGDEVDPFVNYPPGTPYLFGALVLLYDHSLLFVTHTPLTALVSHDGIGPFIAKLPLLLADIALTLLLYYEARKRHSQRFALLAAASFAFSPALLYSGAIWGQTDGLVTLPVLIALFAMLSERYALAGASMAIALLIKPQPVIIIPLILLYLWRWTGRKATARFAIAGLVTALVLLLPVMLPRFQLFDMLTTMRATSYNDHYYLTADAFNFWWLIGYGSRPIGSTFLGVKSALVGDALFGAVALVSGIQIWRHREPAYFLLGLALESFGFFMFMGGQHERYLFLFIPLMLASVIVSARRRPDHLIALYLMGTALCFLNMLVAIGENLFGRAQMIPYLTFQPLSDFVFHNFLIMSLALAVYHMAALAYAMWVYVSGRIAPLPPTHPARVEPAAPRLAVQVAGDIE